MNRISTLAVLLIFLLSAVNIRAQVPENSDKYKYGELFYRILSEGEKTVALTKNDDSYRGVVYYVPSSILIDGVSYTVTEIDDETFMGNNYLSITIPNTIRRIGDRAFAVTWSLSVYSKIQNPLEVEMGKDVFGTDETEYMDFYVSIESEDDYLMSEDWNSRGRIHFYILFNGFYYTLDEEEEHKIADLIPHLSDVPYDEEELVLPGVITYKGEDYDVREYGLNLNNCSPRIRKIILSHSFYVQNLPNLEEIVIDGHFGTCHFDFCPRLKTITFLCSVNGFNNGFYNDNCPLPSLVFKERLHNIAVAGSFVKDIYPFIGYTDAADVYFYDAIPPVVQEGIELNSNLTIHVPLGAKDAFEATKWNICTIIEDLPEQTPKLEYGYNGSNLYAATWGTGSSFSGSTIEHAMRLPAEAMQKYRGAKITEISFYTLPLFVNDRKEENVEYVFVAERGSEEYLAKVPVECVRGTRMTIPLPTPATINDKDLFVGVGKKDVLTTWDATSIPIENGLWSRVFGGNAPAEFSEWENLGKPARPITCTIEGENLPKDIVTLYAENIEGSSSAAKKSAHRATVSQSVKAVKSEAGFSSMVCVNYEQPVGVPSRKAESRSDGKKNVRLMLQNRTPEKIHNFKILATDNGKEALDITMDQPLMPNQTTLLELAVPFVDSSTRTHNFNIGVTEIDGNPDEIPENSNLSTTIYEEIKSSKSYPRKVVVEEGTGTWCGWCPHGIVAMEKMAEKYPDNFIGIAVHSGDRMSDAVNYDPIFEKFISFPISMTNRKEKYLHNPSTASLDAIISEEIAAEAVAQLNAEAEMTQDGKHVKVNTVTRFGYESSMSDVRIAYVITEDGVGPYMQNNAYSGNGDLEGWSDAGPQVSTIYNEVARGIYDYNGIEGSTPKAVKVDEPYSYEYTIEIPSKVKNVENINIIAMLIDGDTGEILNADKVKIGDGSSAIDGITVDGECNEIVAIYNLQGIKVAQPVEGQINIVVFRNGQCKLIRY